MAGQNSVFQNEENEYKTDANRKGEGSSHAKIISTKWGKRKET